MLRRLTMATVGCLAFTIAVTANLHVTADEATPVQAGDPWQGIVVDGFHLSAQTTKSEYCTDEDIDLTVVVKNVAASQRSVLLGPLVGVYEVEVSGPDGRVAPPTLLWKLEKEEYLSSISCRAAVLRPNQTHQESTSELNQLYGMNRPGRYTVVVRYGYVRQPGNGEIVKAVSNSINLTILPPKERP